MPIVIDASVTVTWCYDDQASPLSEVVYQGVRAERAVVPAIWPFDVAHTILSGERRGRLGDMNTERFLVLLRAMPITIDEETSVQAWSTILSLARQFSLSSYDASILELAIRRRVVIATTDEQIIAAARRLSLPLTEAP